MRARLLGSVVAIAVLAVLVALALRSGRAPEPAPAETFVSAGPLDCSGCNLLVVSIDTLRADRLGSYGYARETSPNLDALAAQSLVFRDVLAQASTTAPSHRSLFTGRYVFQHENDTATLPVMAGLLARAGYRTAAFVDGAQMSRRFGMAKGFETFFDTGGYNEEGAHVGGGLEVLGPEVVRWLEAHGDERFFAFLHTYDVHCPYTPPEPYFSMFTDGYQPGFEVEGRCGKHYFNGLDLSADDFAYLGALYDGGVRYTDEKLAPVLGALSRLGLDQNTVVVITSDHGESLGERGTVGHNEVYDVQLKVPLIVHLPSGHHAEIDTPVQSIDVLPTLLATLGVPSPELPGTDVRAFVDAPPEPARHRLAERGSTVRGTVRTDERFSLHVDGGEPSALFDLQRDPAETTDLLDSEPERAERMRSAYEALGARGERVPVYPEDLDEKTRDQLRALGYTL